MSKVYFFPAFPASGQRKVYVFPAFPAHFPKSALFPAFPAPGHSVIRNSSETSNTVNAPWALKEIEGGSLNVEKLVDYIIATIISIHPLPSHSNAFHEILSLVAPGTEVSLLRNPLNANFFFMVKKTKLLR